MSGFLMTLAICMIVLIFGVKKLMNSIQPNEDYSGIQTEWGALDQLSDIGGLIYALRCLGNLIVWPCISTKINETLLSDI